MAKRRVNTKFLAILTAAVVGLGGTAVTYKYLKKDSPEKHVQMAESLMAQGQYEKAARQYGSAFGAGGQKDLDLMMKQADAWSKAAETDPVYVRTMVDCWAKTLEYDSSYVPALRKLTAFYDDMAKQTARLEDRRAWYTRVREYAERLAKADPGDKAAAAKVPVATVQEWLVGTAMPPQQVDDAIAALQRLQPQDPANGEIPLTLSQAYLKKAGEVSRGADLDGADKLRKQASAVFDAALKGQEGNIGMQVRAASVYQLLARQLRSEEDKKAHADRTKAAIDAARRAAKPADESQTSELLQLFTIMAQNGDVEGATALLAEIAKAQPENQVVRLQHARVLASKRETRDKALELLSQPVPFKSRRMEPQTLVELSSLQLEKCQEARDPAEREAAVKQVEATMAKLQQSLGRETVEVLRLRGQIQMLRGQDTEAVQTLVRARTMMEQQGGRDLQLLQALVGAYMQTRQNGEAKAIAAQMVKEQPANTAARRLLTRLLMAENDAAGAEQHVAELEKALPDDAEVKRFRLALLVAGKKTDEARKLYETLPEGDAYTKLFKAQTALQVGAPDDAVRLAEDVRRADPKNHGAIRLLIAAHQARKDPASARRVVDEALAQNPSDVQLQAVRKQLAGATQEEMEAFSREMVEKNADPFQRELLLALVAGREEKPAEALEHLKKAEAINPDSPQVQEQLFMAYLRDGKWDQAGQYAEKLAKANVDKAGGAHYRFRLLMAQNKTADALAVAQELSRKMPEFPQTWVTLAQAQHALNQLEAAVQSYQRALEKQTDNLDALRGIIDAYYAQGRPDDAARYIAQARRTYPSNPSFREVELRHGLRFGDPEQAVAQWEEIRKQQPDAKVNWTNLTQAYQRAINARRGHNDADGVKKYTDQLGQLADEGIKKWPDEPVFYAQQMEIAALRQDLPGAVDAMTRLSARPAWKGKPEPSLMLARLYAQFKKYPEAEAAANAAVSASRALVAGDDTVPLMQLASIQAASGKLDDALKTLDSKPENMHIGRQKLQMLVAAKRYDSAEKLALTLLQKEPKAGDVLNTLVGIYIEGGQFDQAMARIAQVLSADPGNVQAIYGRGLVHLRKPKADLDAAIADLRSVRDKDERNADARYWLAEAYAAKGDTDAAVRELEATLRVVPGVKPVRMRLVQICSKANPPRWTDAERAIREGRAIPELAADPDLATAEVRMLIARRQADRAVEVAKEAVATTKGNQEVVRSYLDALLAAGEYSRLLNETEKAIEQPETAPWWVSMDRAIAKRRLDKKDEAIVEFERALNSPEVQQRDDLAQVVLNSLAEQLGVDEALARIAPKAESNVRFRLVQALLYQSKQDWANAIAAVEKAMAGLDKMTPAERVTVLRLAGTLYLSAQPKPMPDKAMEAFKRSLQDFPEDTAVLNNLASLLTDYLDTPRPQEALQYSQRAYDIMLKAGRVEPLVLDTHGRVLTMVNRVPEGIVLLQDAADRTAIPDVQYHLAEAYMLQKSPEQAQKHLTKAAAAIEAAKKAQQPVDAKMVRRVEELTAQAKQMLEGKAQAGAR